jgi:hypothetical protein
VIDANVARSAGRKDAESIASQHCREFLETMFKETRHLIVITDAIEEEWLKHQSNFASHWLASMYKRGRVCTIEIPTRGRLRFKVLRTTLSEHERSAMLKDIHLLEAALHTDRTVISQDEKVRGYFHNAAQAVKAVTLVVWVNPCQDTETLLIWLQSGAECEKERCLGYFSKDP